MKSTNIISASSVCLLIISCTDFKAKSMYSLHTHKCFALPSYSIYSYKWVVWGASCDNITRTSAFPTEYMIIVSNQPQRNKTHTHKVVVLLLTPDIHICGTRISMASKYKLISCICAVVMGSAAAASATTPVICIYYPKRRHVAALFSITFHFIKNLRYDIEVQLGNMGYRYRLSDVERTIRGWRRGTGRRTAYDAGDGCHNPTYITFNCGGTKTKVWQMLA